MSWKVFQNYYFWMCFHTFFVSTTSLNVTKLHHKIYKPQFKRILRDLAVVKAGFYSCGAALTILIYPSRIYSWCYAETFQDPEWLFEILASCNSSQVKSSHVCAV